MAKAGKLTDKQLRTFLTKGGRQNSKSDFLRILKKASTPIDRKR